MFQTHIAFGLLAGMLSLKYLNVPNPYIYILIVCTAAAMPDIDESESRIGKKIRPLSWLIEQIFGHRNLFHSVFPLIAIYIIFFHCLKWNVAGAALLIGYGSHLFMDMLTYMGIGPLHPFYRKRITGFIKTGGLVEHILLILLVLADIIILSGFL